MTLTRVTLVTAQVLVALVVAALLGAAYAASATSSPEPAQHRVGLHSTYGQSKPIYSTVVYHPHQMCEELHHPATKQSPRS
ncbi:MAG: hypothetical protein WBV37_04490 [Nocardioidaceae bacterium]